MSKLAVYSDASERWHLIEGDALLVLAKLPDACIDAIVSDPPYGIEFQSAAWDGRDMRRVVGERLSISEAFGRWTRVWATEARRILKPGGLLVCFGAPRTFHRLTCGVEDAGFEVRDVVLWLHGQGVPKSRRIPNGLGTALKPAYEPILLARAPLTGTTQRNLETWGTGTLNIDAARIAAGSGDGYWPANVALSHAPDCPAGLIDAPPDGPSRLFFCAKASKAEREIGCEQLPARPAQIFTGRQHPPRLTHNTHPTVKPIALMRWLIRLTVPTSGVVLDPFCGSGTTGIAAVSEGRQFVGIEREGEYVDIACARLTHWAAIAAQKEVLP